MYVTVNRRDNANVLRGLQHCLLDHPEVSAAALPSKLSSIDEQVENDVDHHWLFDFDGTDERHQHFLSTCGLHYRVVPPPLRWRGTLGYPKAGGLFF